jgi:glycosyltransferase involved in cell wall biosynthesis
MRVLVACDWFLKYAVSQVTALDRIGVEAALLCRSHSLEFGGSTSERYELLRQLNGSQVNVIPGRISSPTAASHVFNARRAIARWQPDIVHAHDNADPRLLAIVAGTPRVTTVHDPVAHPGQPALSRIEAVVRHRWIAGASAVVVHGRSLIEELPHWIRRRRIAVVPHGTTVALHPLRIPDRPSVLLFGRLEPYKGLAVLLRAMKRVWTVRPDVVLRIAGAGAEAARIPQDSRIDFREGYVPEHDVEALFAQATLVVLPYIQASQSGVGALALGRGVPTIVSDVGALRDIALDESFLVRPEDEGALASAILRHLDHDESVRNSVIHFARERFSWEACARESLRLYESLLASEIG